ncbi:phage tail terminator protein [Serratia sp. L9]|uniref:phage tail terminator protein n=1 Tax=Serratia sp. L9 TaxID=3423946 RepID=UPI003D67BF7A
MSSGPFDLSCVIERIQSLQPDPLSFVGSVVEYSKVTDLSAVSVPAAYVLMGSERGIPGNGSRAQVAEAVFGIVIVVRNYGLGIEGMIHEANPLIGQVRDLMIGWMPNKRCTTGVQWVKGDVLDYDAGTLVWMDVFTVNHIIGGMRCQK